MNKLSLSLFFFVTLFNASAFAEVEIGKQAPNFTLTDSTGKVHQLSDHKGKFVVLEWVNFDCPFVKKHYGSGNMQSLQEAYTGKGVVWLSINSSASGKQGHLNSENAEAIKNEKGSKATALLLDSDGKVGKLYDAKTTPHMYVINPESNLIYQGAIDDRAGTDPAEIKDSKNYVQQALDEAMSGGAVSESQTKSYGCSVKY